MQRTFTWLIATLLIGLLITGCRAITSAVSPTPLPTAGPFPTFTPTPAIVQSDEQVTDAQMATIAKLDALCPVEKGAMFLTAIYCFGFDFNLSTRGPGGTTDDEVHLFLLPVAANGSESQNADDAYVKLDIHPIRMVEGQPQNETAADCQVQPAQRSSALDDASFAISKYQVVYTEYRCGAEQRLRKDLLISYPPLPTIQVTFAALSGTDAARFNKLFAAFVESFTFYSPDQLASPSPVSLLPTVTPTPAPTPSAAAGTTLPLPAPLYFLGKDQQIWRLARDGVFIARLTTESSPIVDFDISPTDGSLAYVAGGMLPGQPETAAQLILTNAWGQQRKTLPITSTVSTVRWSPDGKQLAYDSAEGIYMAALDGTAVLRLAVKNASERYTVVSWSPDGKRLLVDQWGQGPGWVSAVFNLQDNSLVRLERSCCQPIWRQDSSGVYYAVAALGEVWPGLWFVSATSGKSQTLIKSVSPQNDLLPWVAYPYNNGDTLLAFVGTAIGSGWPFSLTLSQIHVDGSTTPIHSDAYRMQEALWATDGSGVLIVSYSEQKTWPPIGKISWLGRAAEQAVALEQQGYKLHWGLETANLEQRR